MQQSPYALMGHRRTDLQGAKPSRGIVKRAWAFAKPFHRKVYFFLAVIVVEALLGLVPPLLIRRIIDTALPEKNKGMVTILAGIMIIAAFANALLSLVERFLSSNIGEGLIFRLRTALFEHVQKMPLSFFTRTQTGALISRMNNDVIGAQQAVTQTLGSVVSNVVVLVTTLTAMALLQWQLTLLSLVLLPLFIIPAKRVGRQLQGITRDGMNLNASMNATMNERFNVSGALLVKLFGRRQREVDDFSDRAGKVRDIGIKSAMYSRTFIVALTAVGAVGTAAIYLVGGRMVVDGTVSLGTLIALGAFVTQIYSPLTALTNARVDLMTAFVSFDRVFEVLDAPIPIDDKPDATELTGATGLVELDDVRFQYPAAADVSIASLESDHGQALSTEPSAPVLRGITARFEPGQLIALVGPSGAGKTTLSQLVPRIYDVTSGSLKVDGHDVRDLTQDSLRAAIGVVSQDPHLFHESVGDNLRYAKPDATDGELDAACRAARIDHVIDSLPERYDTVVGERGYRLSGGEKQRLAIARMLLKDPAIVILDEATSHLDSENEALIQDALATGLRGRTSLVIAHRLSTITTADQILVLDEGRIVERGRHHDLMAQGGLYADLYRTLQRTERTAATAPDAVELREDDAVVVD